MNQIVYFIFFSTSLFIFICSILPSDHDDPIGTTDLHQTIKNKNKKIKKNKHEEQKKRKRQKGRKP